VRAVSEPVAILESLNLHPEIKFASAKLFSDGHYASSILEAYKALDYYVRRKSGRDELSGKSLMSEVFSARNPILALNALRNESERDEQEGFMHLFMGAMVGIRNPKAHEIVQQQDPYRTIEYLAFASMLAKRVDDSNKLR
jgi:uncharacterized protein (TIGR02391 family)